MAAPQMSQGTVLRCMWGVAPPPASPLPAGKPILIGGTLAANVSNQKLPETGTFGLCTSPANPPVAMTGVPAPCVPSVAAPWLPGNPRCMVGGMPTVNLTSSCMCVYSMGPNIRPLAGQTKVMV